MLSSHSRGSASFPYNVNQASFETLCACAVNKGLSWQQIGLLVSEFTKNRIQGFIWRGSDTDVDRKLTQFNLAMSALVEFMGMDFSGASVNDLVYILIGLSRWHPDDKALQSNRNALMFAITKDLASQAGKSHFSEKHIGLILTALGKMAEVNHGQAASYTNAFLAHIKGLTTPQNITNVLFAFPRIFGNSSHDSFHTIMSTLQ